MLNRVAAAATLSILLAGCGGDDTTTAQPAEEPSATATATPSDAPTQPAPQASTRARGTVIKTADSQFGEVLFDGDGQAIYLFDKEKTTKPECYDECAEAWPPVLTDGEPAASASAREDRLGTTTRTDDSVQVTYAGHPLYYYAHEGRNEVRCHNVREFGGLWLAVIPAGAAAPR